MKVILIPCGATEWRDSGRLLGRVEVPLTDEGRAKCGEWAALFGDERPACIYHSSDELATETAALIAKPLKVPTKSIRGLDEVDVGLWAGLTQQQLKSRYESAFRQLCDSPLNTQQQLKSRYESAFRQLCDSPLNVSAPDGETFGNAVERVTQSLKKKLKRNGGAMAGFVMRPLALAATRCDMEERPMSEFWATSMQTDAPVVLDCTTRPAQATLVGSE